MKLAELVAADRIVIPLEVPRVEGTDSLHAAALLLLDRLAAAGIVEDPPRLRTRIEEARGEDVVGLGDRAFILHYRSDAVRDIAAAIGVAAEPVERQMRDTEAQRARILLMIVSPPRLAARYLQVLGGFVRLLAKPETVSAMLAAPDANALLALPELQETLPEQLAVRDIMTEWPRTTRPDALLREAARDMARGGIGALPVVDQNGLLVGMLTDRELMRHMLSVSLAQGAQARRAVAPTQEGRRNVRDVMTRQVLAVSPEQPLAEVASLMVNKDVAHVPVVREGKLVGFLTRADIVRKLIGS